MLTISNQVWSYFEDHIESYHGHKTSLRLLAEKYTSSGQTLHLTSYFVIRHAVLTPQLPTRSI